MRRWSIHTKLLSAFFLVLLPVLCLLLARFFFELRQTREGLLQAQEMTARSVAVQVAEAFDGAIELGSIVARDPLVRTLDAPGLDRHLRQLVERSPFYEAIAVYDAQGHNRGWGDPREPAEPRLDIHESTYFQQVMTTRASLLSEVSVLQRPQRLGLLACVPIPGPSGRPIGVVTVVMDSELLASRYMNARLQQRQEVFLADARGRMAFHTGSARMTPWQSEAFVRFGPLQQALAGVSTRVGPFLNPFWGQEQHLGAFAPLPRYPWAVGVSVPVQVALAPLHAQLRLWLTSYVGLTLLSACLALLLARLQARPVQQLQQAVQALGRGELGRRVHIRSGDELEALGTAFNEMAEQISWRAVQVRSLHAEAERQALQLAAIITSVPDAIFLATPEGWLVGANPAGRQLFGLGDSEELKLSVADCHRCFDVLDLEGRPLEEHELPLMRALRGETFIDTEVRLRSRDGGVRVLSINGAPVRDAQGHILLGQIVARDITRRRQQQEEQERVLERERAVSRMAQALVSEMELARLAEVIIEQSFRVLGSDASGLWLAEPEARRLTLLSCRGMGPKEREQARHVSFDSPTLLARTVLTGRTQCLADLPEEELPEGSRVWVERGVHGMVSIPLYAHGRLVGVMGHYTRVARRFTPRELEFHGLVVKLFAVALEKARLFQEMTEALRLREEFMSAAAHELKTPVTTVQTWAELLLAYPPLTPRQHKGLTAMLKNARRMGRLVEHLFDAVKLAPGPLKLERTSFDLSALLHEQVARLARTTEHPIELDVPSSLWLHADRDLVAQVVDHLLENALRYSPPDGAVELRGQVEADAVVLSVHDQGPGIPQERQPHVFEPLYEPLPPGAHGYTGLVGLGLNLSRQIVEAHGGRIWLESAPETGTTFSVRLPRDGAPSETHLGTHSSAASAREPEITA